jgi:hypothetical protein
MLNLGPSLKQDLDTPVSNNSNAGTRLSQVGASSSSILAAAVAFGRGNSSRIVDFGSRKEVVWLPVNHLSDSLEHSPNSWPTSH